MRILHVGESIRGGCGTYLNEIVPLQAGCAEIEAVHCLVPRQHAAHLVDVPPALISTFERPSRLGGLRHLAAGIRSALRKSRPDVIHAHSTFAGGLVRLLSVPSSMPPIVYCPHGWAFEVEQPRAARAAVRAVERLLSYRSHRIIAISEAERRQGLEAGISEQRLALVPNGIGADCTKARAQWDDPRLKLLFVGRLDRQKGLDVLLQAVRELHDTVSVRVLGAQVVGGEGVQDAEVAPHVEYRGWCAPEEVAAQINACDAVVMPSRWEGFGLVALEAMRAGKAVIASAVGGLVEIVDDGVTGFLVAPGDAAALSVTFAACTRPQLHAMGEAGRRRFLAHYTIDRTHRGLLEVYRQILAAPHMAPATVGEDLRS